MHRNDLGSRGDRPHAVKLFDALNAPEFEPWALVDTALTSNSRNAASADDRNATRAG